MALTVTLQLCLSHKNMLYQKLRWTSNSRSRDKVAYIVSSATLTHSPPPHEDNSETKGRHAMKHHGIHVRPKVDHRFSDTCQALGANMHDKGESGSASRN